MGLGTNKMVKLFSFLFITVFFISNGRSQKLYIPVSNEEIIKIYKLGKKSSSGEYVYTDKDGNIRIKGKFNKNIPVGKWYLFYKDGGLMANYGYNDNGELDGVFAEYYETSKLKKQGFFIKNIQNKLWKTFYEDGKEESIGQMLEGKKY